MPVERGGDLGRRAPAARRARRRRSARCSSRSGLVAPVAHVGEDRPHRGDRAVAGLGRGARQAGRRRSPVRATEVETVQHRPRERYRPGPHDPARGFGLRTPVRRDGRQARSTGPSARPIGWPWSADAAELVGHRSHPATSIVRGLADVGRPLRGDGRTRTSLGRPLRGRALAAPAPALAATVRRRRCRHGRAALGGVGATPAASAPRRPWPETSDGAPRGAVGAATPGGGSRQSPANQVAGTWLVTHRYGTPTRGCATRPRGSIAIRPAIGAGSGRRSDHERRRAEVGQHALVAARACGRRTPGGRAGSAAG